MPSLKPNDKILFRCASDQSWKEGTVLSVKKGSAASSEQLEVLPYGGRCAVWVFNQESNVAESCATEI